MEEERDPANLGALGEPAFLDTSALTRYLRPHGWETLKHAVQRIVTQDRIATCWVVRSELLTGTRDHAAFELLLDRLRGIPDIPITAARWRESARLGLDLRKQGITIALTDLLIAQCAIHSGRVLWHADSDYERIREHTTLRTLNWLDIS